ncbi:alpha/beta hydrolase-fold protein [Mycobacterium sp. M26]|uniref:alpha/beta hydrolase n=1 Tax=Mycobacterium sp. M26 TaxID=1762962 RepID=UPI000B2304C0|nr:alpha/beta hydrolase-fold protein [Mycobacterium sp. M26]
MAGVRIVLAIVVAVLLAGCGGSAPKPPQQASDSGAILQQETVSGTVPAAAAEARRITYVSRSGVDDSTTHVTGSVYVPRSPAPPGGYHVVAYGPAIAGSGPGCARPQPNTINDLLTAGYVVAVPDYQGLGDPSDGKRLYYPALDSTTAGYNLIDAVRAAKNLVADTSPIWAAMGEVQGGQAAWALNELADNYGFGSLRGTVSLSPLTDLAGLADAAADGTLTPEQQRLYISYLAALATEYKGQFRLDDYRRGAATQHWDLLLGCQPADDAARAAASAQISPDDLRPATPAALATLRTYLRKTSLPQGPAQQPMLVSYGDQDTLAPASWTERAIARACGMGDQITVRPQPSPTLDPDVLTWIASRLSEQPVPNDCESFLAAHPIPAPEPEAEPQPGNSPSAVPAASPPGDIAPAGSPGLSLIDGWLPVALQVVAGAAVIAAVGWRTRRWRLRWLPVSAAVGVVLIGAVWWFVDRQGLGSVYPWGMWVWIGLTGLAAAVLVLGWPGSPWWRRLVAILAVPLCVVAAAAVLNASLGYLPTVQTAWQRVTGQLPPQWIDQAKLAAMQRDGVRPTRGTVVSIVTPGDVSGFAHRTELVYLPPVWFTSNPPPELPVVMMLGAELSSPADWLQSGHALSILDDFALQHRGVTPVVVFPDTSGSFTNDTECVNGPRGNAADHLVNEFVPYVISTFGVSDQAANWGLVGWSSGGTCALTLTVRHPDKFSAFVDLDGQLGPNAGKRQQTIARLFGGDEQAWAAFDPKTIVEKRGYYYDVAAWLGVSADVPTVHRAAGSGSRDAEYPDWDTYSEDHNKTANQLCELLAAHGVECSVVGYRGGHDFGSAASGFRDALPWLAGRIGTPGVPSRPLPGG